MGVPTSKVGYTPAMPSREDHEVHKGHVVALGGGDIAEAWDPNMNVLFMGFLYLYLFLVKICLLMLEGRWAVLF